MSDDDPILTPAEVAAMFNVSYKTVARWANRGLLNPFRTLQGHRRYRKSDVERAMKEAQQ